MTTWLLMVFLQVSGFLEAAHAQGLGNPPQTFNLSDLNPFGSRTLDSIAGTIANNLLVIAIPIAAIMVVVGGFQIMTAGGSEEKFKSGRKTLLYAAIGFAVILLAQGVVAIIKSFLGA